MSSVPEAAPQEPLRRYSNVTVAFHWTTVALVIAQIAVGFVFHEMDRGPARSEVFAWHKTLGVLILLITLARLGYRLANPPPPYSTDLPAWERIVGTWNHRIFYGLLIAIPLAGLTAVSARANGPTTQLVGGIPFPVIPGVSEDAGELAGEIHGTLVYILMVGIVLHAAAALKHQFFDRAKVSGRMPPFRPPSGRQTVIGQGSRAASVRADVEERGRGML